MKPLSELVKEWRLDGKKLSGDAALTNQSCADELQAWLREADKELALALAEASPSQLEPLGFIRDSLLGTTQKPKQEGEK